MYILKKQKHLCMHLTSLRAPVLALVRAKLVEANPLGPQEHRLPTPPPKQVTSTYTPKQVTGICTPKQVTSTCTPKQVTVPWSKNRLRALVAPNR